MRLPPLKALQALEAFGRLGSVMAAAAELGVTSGAVSQQLKKAEEALDIRLLERRGKLVELTAWGKIYHAELVKGFEQLRAAQNTLQRLQSTSDLVVSCLPSLANKWLGPLLFDWQTKNKDANLKLLGRGSEPRLGDDTIDFRISYGDRVRDFDYYVELFTDWVVPACSPAFLKANPVNEPADILTLPRLDIKWDGDYRPAPGWSEWAMLINAQPRLPQGELAFSLSSSAIESAINGRGFVLAQLAMINEDLAAERLVVPFNLPLQLSQAYFLAWDRAALSKPYGHDLRAFIVALARQQRAITEKHLH